MRVEPNESSRYESRDIYFGNLRLTMFLNENPKTNGGLIVNFAIGDASFPVYTFRNNEEASFEDFFAAALEAVRQLNAEMIVNPTQDENPAA